MNSLRLMLFLCGLFWVCSINRLFWLSQYSIQNLLCVKAKMHALSPVSTNSFQYPNGKYSPNHSPGAALTRKFLDAVQYSQKNKSHLAERR